MTEITALMTVIAFIGFILLILHLIEPQCSNATDSEAQRSACAEELEHAAKEKIRKMKLYDNAMLAAPFMEYPPSDCNNSSAMTRELPLSDESRQWIAKDTCSGRDSADTRYMTLFANALHQSADRRQMQDEQLCNRLRQFTTPEEIHAMELTNTERIRRWNAIRNGDEVVHDE